MSKKVQITGASNFVNRMFEACGKFQWAREFLKNSIEAGATQISFGLEWQAVKQLGVYRRTINDDGAGMSGEDLLNFFSTLGMGAKKIGGVHDNFGIGAKIASLPWNPNGLVIISYKNGVGSMIWIFLNEDTGEYEITSFDRQDGNKTYVIDPAELETSDGIMWGSVAPDWVQRHGTCIVLLGSDAYPDTILGNPDAGEDDLKGLTIYLNTRFWDLTQVNVSVLELRSTKKNQWPQDRDDKEKNRSPFYRTIKGAKFHLTEVKSDEGKLASSDVLFIEDDRVLVEWYLWEGVRPEIHQHAKKGGYIALRYKDELFQITSSKVDFRQFGIIESVVQSNLSLIIEPQLKDGTAWGVHPDQSRNQLIFSGNGEKGVQIPLHDWGMQFANKMPLAIRDAIRKARSGQTGSISDDEYRRRLQDRFGARWTAKILVDILSKISGDNKNVKASGNSNNNEEGSDTSRKPSPVSPSKNKSIVVGTNGTEKVQKEIMVDVPKFRLVQAENFEEPWHLASWVPQDPDGPTVLINTDSPILQESVEHHTAKYPDIFADDVAKIVRNTFGELAACKIAHSQTLTKHIPQQDLDSDYRNDKALTISLMGLLAEESVIAHRLKRLGHRVGELEDVIADEILSV